MLPLRLIVLTPLGTVLLLSGCKTPTASAMAKVQIAEYSPAAVQTADDPWQQAQTIAQGLPNAWCVKGQGNSMQPLYPDGTVMVLQKLAWDQLTPGMTVVYGADPNNLFNLGCGTIVKKAAVESWTVRELLNSRPETMTVTTDNYIGTVVAAVHGRASARPGA